MLKMEKNSVRCNVSDKTPDVAHQTTDLVSGASLLMVDEATAITTPPTETPTETPPMTGTQLVIAPTDLQGMKETVMAEGISTLLLDHLSVIHVMAVHHAETTQSVAALLTVVRTDILLILLTTLIVLQVLDMYASTLLLTQTR